MNEDTEAMVKCNIVNMTCEHTQASSNVNADKL